MHAPYQCERPDMPCQVKLHLQPSIAGSLNAQI
jgi:hypothetical protein